MAHKCLVLLVVALATSRALAGPLTDSTAASDQCSTWCSAGDNDKFSFDADKTHEYQYESDVKTSMGGASEEHSSLHLRATAHIEVLSRCEMALRLSGVSLQDSEPGRYESRSDIERSAELKAVLEARLLRFSFIDGQVESICGEQEEPVWAMNIKRGILSAFQNTMESLDEDKRVFETDVTGICPTEYENKGTLWNTRTVKKTKDLIGCIERNGPQSAFQGAPFQVPSDIQTLPIMKSTHECEQKINGDGLLTQSICTESHVFRPFSRQENGAKTEITTKLTFTRQVAGVTRQRAAVRQRSSLLFDHTLTAEEQAENVRQAKQTLTDLCSQSETDIRPDVPSLFTRFVREARKLQTNDLSRLFDVAVRGVCGKAEKFFRDAIPVLGTEASTNLIRKLIQEDRATEAEADIWLTSISTSIHRPSKPMIMALKPLLTGSTSRKAYLAVSSLINNYCTLNEGCDSDGEIQAIIRIFTEQLRYNCRQEGSDDHDNVLMALKALGNTGHAESAVPTLQRCAANAELSMELRVVALQSFRRMSCVADRTELFNLLSNIENDAELRIHAYLVLMTCPDANTLQRVLLLLENEQVNQVGSFIWTHLTNLQETSNPHKQQIRAILENEELKKTFDMDKRKFSRNIEMSLFSELLNMGGSVESNVIFSEKSFIPRSVMLNLTAELFGQSINFFELGGRLQGMEQLLERFFGPDGKVSDGREKRSLIRDESINMLDRSFDAERERMGMSYFLRMFGNEIRYGDLHNFDLSNIKDKLNFLEWLIELASDHDFEVTKSMMFFDLAHVIPTSAGLPLKLEADGAATINVKVNGKMDIRRMFTSPSTFDISGSVKPSAALEVTSMMGIDAFVAKTGLKMVTTLHTSTVAQGKFQLAGGKIFNMDWDIPQDKMEIISAESKFFVVWRDVDREQNMLNTGERSSHSKCIGDKFTTVLGLELCGEISYPWDPKKSNDVPFFPFTGPMSTKVYLNKKDSHTGFHFEAKYIQDKTRAQTGVQIKDIAKVQFNTPGSSVDRELAFEFEMDRASKQMKISMKSPWKKVDMNAAMVKTDSVKSISARTMIDDNSEYAVTAQLTTQGSDSVIKYIPDVQVIIPGRENIVLDGSVTLRQNRKFDVDLALKNLFARPFSVRGSVDKINNRRRMKYGGELELSSSFLTGRVEGFVDHNKASAGQSLASRLTVEYSYQGGQSQSIVLSNKIRDKSTETDMSYSLDSAWRTSYWPRYDGEVSVDVSLGKNAMSADIQAGLDNVRKIVFTQAATYEIGANAATVDGTARLQFPLKHIDYEVKLDHMHNTVELKSAGAVKAGEQDLGSLDLGLKRESTIPLKMSGEAKLLYPGREMAWTQSIEEKNPKEYHHNLDIQLQKYENVRLESVYKMTPIHDLSATLTIPDFEPMSLNARLNPDLSNLMTHIDTTFLGNTYLVEVSNILRGNYAPNFSIKNGLSLQWPGRQIDAKTQVSRRAQVLSVSGETSWEADSKVTVNGQMTMDKQTPAMQMKVTWPQNFASVEFEGVYQEQEWYTTNNDMQAKVRFTSGFPGFEDLSASIEHDLTTKGVKTEVEASWDSNKKVNVEFILKKLIGFKQIESILKIGTPFVGYRMFKGELAYNLGANTFESTTKAQWENRVSQLEFNGEISLTPQRLISGVMTFTSPYNGFESITATLRHTDNGRTFNSNFETQWSPSQRISTQFQMTHFRRGYEMKNNGEMVITTPFHGYRQSKLTWNHENDENKVKHHIELECDSNKSLFDLDAMHRLSRSKRSWEVKTILQTPLSYAKDLRMNLAHSNDLNSWENIKSDGSLQWARGQSISYEHEIDAAPGKLNMKSKFLSPFTEVITLDMTNQIQERFYGLTNELSYGSNKKIVFESSGSYQETIMRATAQITTPFPYLKKVALTQVTKKENDIWIATTDFEYAPEQVIQVIGQLGMDSIKMGSLALKTPFEYARDVYFGTKFDGHGRDFECTTELEHNMLGQKMSLFVKMDTANLKKIRSTIDFQSPFDVLRFVKGSFVHFRNNGGKIQNKLSIQTPQYQGQIDNNMRIRGWQMHSTNTEIEYFNGQKIEISHEFSVGSTVEGKVTLKTPFDGARVMSLNFEHEGQATDFKTTGVVNYNGYIVNGEYAFKLEGTNMASSAKIETSYNLISIDFTHSGDYRQFSNNLNINFNGKLMTGSTEFNLNNMEPTGRISIATPYYILKSMNMNFEHTGRNWRNFENNGAFEYNGGRYTAGSEFKLTGKVMRMSAKVNIPSEYSFRISQGLSADFTNNFVVIAAGYENFELSIKHAGPGNNFQTSANVVTPFSGYNKMGAEVTYNLNGNTLRTTVKVTTPLANIPTVIVALRHDGFIKDFTTVLSADYMNKKVEFTTRFNLGSTVFGSIKLTTPYTNMEQFVVGFNHEGTLASFKTEANVETPFRGYERMSAEYTHSTTASGFTCYGRFESTIPNFQSIQLTLNHDMPADNAMISNIALDTSFPGYKRFSVDVNHRGGFITMRSSGSIETPFSAFDRFNYEIDHDASNVRRISSSGNANTPVGAFSHVVTFNGNAKKFKTSAVITTPFSEHQRYEISMDHTARTETTIKNSAKLVTPMGEFTYSFDHQGPKENFATMFEVTSPFPGNDRYSLSLNHEGASLTSILTTVEATTPIGAFLARLNHRGDLTNMNTKLEVNTPFRGYDRFIIELVNSYTSSKVATSATLTSSMGDFSFTLNFDGDITKFQANSELTTFFPSLRRLAFTLDHASPNIRNIVSEGSLMTPLGDFGAKLNYKGFPKNLKTSLEVSTPFRGYEDLAAEIEHNARDIANIVSKSQFRTPLGLFKHEFTHAGSPSNFRTNLEINTPFIGYESMTGSLNHDSNDMSRITSNGNVNTPWGQFGISLVHNGSPSQFTTTLTVTTPFRGYDEMSASLSHSGPSMADIESTLTLNTPYGQFGSTLMHKGTMNKFTSSVTISTPFRPYRTMSASVTHDGKSLKNFQTSTTLVTPIGQFEASLNHNGVPTRFTSSVSISTPIEGYGRMSASLSNSARQLSNIQSSLTVVIPSGTYDMSLNHEGVVSRFTTTLTLTTPIRGYERMTAVLTHAAVEVSDIETSLTVAIPTGEYEVNFNHKGLLAHFSSTGFIRTPHRGYERMSVTISHSAADLSSIESSISSETPIGRFEISLNHQGKPSRFTSTVTAVTPFSGYKRMVATITHTGRDSSSIVTSVTLDTPIGQYQASLNHRGRPSNFRTSLTLNTPHKGLNQKSWVIENNSPDITNMNFKFLFTSPSIEYKYVFTHEGAAERFITKFIANSPYSEIDATIDHTARDASAINSLVDIRTSMGNAGYSFVHEAIRNGIKSSLALTTPFRGFEEIGAAVEHTGYELSAFKTSAKLTMQMGVFSAAIDHAGSPRKFVTALEVITPIRGFNNYKLVIDNDCEDIYNMLTKAQLNIPQGEFVSSISYNGNPKKFLAALNIATPFESFRTFEIKLDHTASDFTRIVSSGTMKTPIGDFGINVNHNGDWKRMTSTGTITTPFSGYENFNLNIDHDATNLRNIESNIVVSCSRRTMSLAVNHRGSLKNIRSSIVVETPFRNWERLGVTIQNNARDLSEIKSNVQIVTPLGPYAYDLQFNGVPKQFTFILELNSPHQKFEMIKMTTEVDVTTLSALRLSSKIDTSIGQYGFKLSHDGNLQAFESVIEVASPHTPYNKFGCGFRTAVESTASVPGYERFSTSVHHTGGTETPKTVISVGTPFRQHESYTMTTEKSGNLANLLTKAQLNTPKGLYVGTYSHEGQLKNFRCEGSIDTPHRGYDRFGFTINHNGEPKNLRTSASITTPIRNWQRLGAQLRHSTTTNNKIQTGLTINTAYPGFEEFVANLSHEGTFQSFDTDFQMTTPITGYRNFGFKVVHGGHIKEFNSRGTVTLPFSHVPSVTIDVGHRGDLMDFLTTGSVEYNNKKIEGEALFKKTTGRSSSNYDGTFKISSPYDYLRNVVVTGVHTRNGDVKTGSLDVMHNEQKSVDFDYTYNTGALRNLEIEIRQPYPMSSKVNMRGSRNDAVVNWDTRRTDSQVRFDLNMKNEEAEKELTVRATLPSRTVGFTTTYAYADGRMTHSSEVMWDNSAETKAGYNVELSKSSRRSQNINDGRLSFASPLGSMEATFNHVCSPGRQYTTEVTIQRLNLKSDVVMTDAGHTTTFTAQHPRLPSNLMLAYEASFQKSAIDGTVRLTYDSENFQFIGHLSDASSWRETVYNARAHLTHPNSNLDAKWEAQYKDNSDAKSVTMNGQYLTSYDRAIKTATLRADINKLRHSLDMEIITPVKALTVIVSEKTHDAGRGIHAYEIVGTMDEHSLRAEFNMNAEEKLIEMKVFHDGDDYVHVYSEMPSPSHAKTEVYTMINGARRQHALASVRITDDQLVSSRFFLNPTLQQEVEQYINQVQRTSTYRRMSRQIQTAFENEINRKQRQLSRAVAPFQPAVQFAQRQVNSISAKLHNAYDVMYRENHFYFRDTSDAMQTAFVQLRQKIDIEQMSVIVDKIEVALSKMNVQMLQFVVNTHPYWNKLVSSATDATLYVIDQLRNNKVVAWTWNKLMTIDIPDLLSPFESRRSSMMNRLQPHVDKVKAWWSEIEKRPEMRYIKAHVKRMLAKSAWALRYMEFDQRIKEVLRELHHISLSTYRSQMIQKIRQYLQLEKTHWSTWNPEGGELGFDVYWPFHWDDIHHLYRLRDIDIQKYINMAKEMINEYMPVTPEFNLVDLYYRYRPSTDYFNWIPPFKTYAAVMGSQHFMTFDKRFYEFAGECSYLLARDFIDGTFSVAVNYQRQRGRPVKKSLSIITNGKQVEVFNDGRVVVDGSRIEMPVAFGNTTISRIGSMIRVDNTLGLTVDCNLPYDRCTVNVTGWYFSKTGGLFGTYNNEPADDFTTAENTRASTPEQLADSWTAGQRCRPENYAVNVAPEPHTEAYKICSRMFKEDASPFRPCYKVVDPQPFQKMCENDLMLKENRLPTEQDACNANAFYVDVCRREGVNVRIPHSCVRCEIESMGAEFTEGQNYTLEGDAVPQSADVVFILQHAECNEVVLANLKDVVDDMEKAFKSTGITNNRYSIIGYGATGSLNTPHIRTMDGQVFNTHDKILLGLDDFTKGYGESADALAAIYYASKLPYRAGVSKSIVMVPCTACMEMSVSYADVEQVLMQKDIHLHMLMEHNFKLNVDKDPVSAYIFGADSRRVFTRKDAGGKVLEGDNELRQQVQMPKDLCAALAMETDGSIFNTLQWTQSRPYMQKRFIDVMVRLFAEKGHPESCQKCDCVSDEYGVGRAVCKTCQTTRSFYSFLPGFGFDESSEEAPEFSFEETTTVSPKRVRMLRRKNHRRQRNNNN
ncbi:hypothetical protein CAPTEDRAFT_222921 [Capitella teleta]|uniref:Vitellogenin domain-containing protein n=1 Tax=Capitella teleta TaxID=283909 RepID=X2ATR8_CAPTE|nr:hypothetical protein CAPTEDRAFT_222921 [Capitella teleta]|eukprot:ELU04621.1 hypothetical protein CAPTEDRAFT_222921 [Capitella teleta]